MSNYSVSLIFSADWGIDIEAESPEEAAESAYNHDESSVSVCHQCAGHINIGDCIRVIVYDENGNEVLDDGYDQKTIESLTAKVVALEDERDLAWSINPTNSESVLVKQLTAEQHKVKVLSDALEAYFEPTLDAWKRESIMRKALAAVKEMK